MSEIPAPYESTALPPGDLKLPRMDHDVTQLTTLMETLDELYTSVMKKGLDFGPGRKGGKSVLLKPGAEKIFGLFNLTARTRIINQSCDHERGAFSYQVVCYAYDRASGALVAEAMGACSSREKRLLNDNDPFSLFNVCLKMAEKRAFVNCALRLGMASERFTQDMEDMSPTADPEIVIAILDCSHHIAFSEHERKRTRGFLMDNPDPERAVEFLEKMKARVEKYEKNKAEGVIEERETSVSDGSGAIGTTGAILAVSVGNEERVGTETRDEPPVPLQVAAGRIRSPGRESIALAYLSVGMAVIPLSAPNAKSDGKSPLIPKWQAFSRDMPTVDHVISWWARYPRANMGCVCGRASGFFVLDVDGDQGEESMLLRDMPHTPRVKTGRGYHYYFSMEPPLKLKNAKGFLPGLDIRADGGQVVVPPSKHKNGQKYIWEVMPVRLCRAFADIEIFWEGAVAEFAPAPEWILEEVLA